MWHLTHIKWLRFRSAGRRVCALQSVARSLLAGPMHSEASRRHHCAMSGVRSKHADVPFRAALHAGALNGDMTAILLANGQRSRPPLFIGWPDDAMRTGTHQRSVI